MGRIVRKINPFSIFQFEHLENWLEEMAGKGLVLKKVGGIIMTFEETEPCEKKYRTIPEYSDVSDEEIDFYEQSGWHYIGRRRIHILCNDDKDAPELFTDKESYNARAANLLRNLKQLIVLNVLVLLFILLLFFVQYNLYYGWIHMISELQFKDVLFITVIYFYLIVSCIYETVGTIKVVKRIRSGAVLDRDSRISKKASMQRWINRIMICFLTGWLVGLCISSIVDDDIEYETYAQQIKKTERQIEDPKEKHPLSVKVYDKAFYTDLKKQIAEEYKKTKEIKKLEDDPDYDPPRFERYKEKKNLFKKYNCEYSCTKGERGTYYDFEYYEADSEWIAKKYIEEEIKYWGEGKTAEQIKFDLPGADYAGFGRDEYGRYSLYVRKGNKFEIAVANKDPGIRDKADLFLKDLMD